MALANEGKFVDRTPSVKAAGYIAGHSDHVNQLMTHYNIEEAAGGLLREKCNWENTERFQRDLVLPTHSMQELLTPDLRKSRFISFRDGFMENLFFPKTALGKVHPLGLKPAELNNYNYSYGNATVRSDPLYEVVLPKKDPLKVNEEYYKFHDKYVLSHKHYFPSERKNRQ